MLGGALSCAAVVLVMSGLHPTQPAPAGRDASWALHYDYWLIVALTVAVVLTATVVSVTSWTAPGLLET